MSKKLTKEEFLAKLSDKCRDSIEIIEFNGSSKPLVAKIKATGEVRTWTMANQLMQNTTGTFKPKRYVVHNSQTIEGFQAKVDQKFGEDMVKVLEFTHISAPVVFQCLNCGEIKEFATAAHLLNVEKPCQYCYDVRRSMADCQEDIDNVFGKGEFTIVSFVKASYPIIVQHKCGARIKKNNLEKVKHMLGCPFCERAKSKGERDIANFLLKHNIPFETEYGFSDLRGEKYPLRFDFKLNNKEQILLIEYDGEGHYDERSQYYRGQELDKIKDDYCDEHNIPLLRIPYWKYKQINELILQFLKFNDYPLGEQESSDSETLNTTE